MMAQVTGVDLHWDKGEHSGAGAQWIHFGFLTKREPGLAVCASVTNIGQSVHSKLHQFSRLYERVSGDRQWWVCVSLGINCSVTRWCFSREVAMLFD